MTHTLKILPKYYKEVVNRTKTFELRKDDRPYNIGDIIKLQEFTGTYFTGKTIITQIVYLLRDCEEYGLKKGFVIIGIK